PKRGWRMSILGGSQRSRDHAAPRYRLSLMMPRRRLQLLQSWFVCRGIPRVPAARQPWAGGVVPRCGTPRPASPSASLPVPHVIGRVRLAVGAVAPEVVGEVVVPAGVGVLVGISPRINEKLRIV